MPTRAALQATHEALDQLIPKDNVIWNVADLDTGTVEFHTFGGEQVNHPCIGELLLKLHDHPMIVSYLSEVRRA